VSTALQQPPRPRPLLSVPRATEPALTLREIGHGYRPGRSFVLSLFLHQIALVLVILLGRHALLRPSIMVVRPTLEMATSADILYLPSLGGGAEGSGDVGGGSGRAQISSTGVQARSRRGFAYPGSQPIVSNPPNATLGIQTILQPSLEGLPRLRSYVELPNIVQPPAQVETAPKLPPIIVKSGKLAVAKPVEAPVAAPKLSLPAASSNNLAELVATNPQLPKAAPQLVDAPEAALAGGRDKGLLVLNAIPPPPDVKGNIPRGEARSLFAVAPGETTIIAEPSGGSASASSAPAAPGTGGPKGARTGDAIAEVGSGGKSTGAVVSGEGVGNGIGSGHGDANGAGLSAVAGTGPGRGDTPGSGVGTGSATGRGSGTGAGSAPGHGGFPGITIQGGRYGNSANLIAKVPAPRRQTSYSMTIESTAGSGGLPDLGVFRNEKVYTVYLDMRSSDDDRTPSWTLQYSVLHGTADRGSFASLVPRAPTPPYAVLKQVPQFSPAIVRSCERRLIVASAILGIDGKLQEVLIKQTPENQVAVPLVQALKEWMFEPAKIDGHPVALKILLGIRLPILQ
jgi:hypothetical protein